MNQHAWRLSKYAGGVEMEEKGERYRDGDKVRAQDMPKEDEAHQKALRFYERALELYTKAFGLENTYDAAYNR